mgnify:CR=1 FL=1
MITVTLTQKRHIAAVTAAYLASIPTTDPPTAVGTGGSVQGFVQAKVQEWAEQLAESTNVDRIPVSAFVRRFPGAAMDAVNAAAATDATVAAILAQLDAVQTVRLGHPTTTQGVGYLVSVGLLTQAQADVVLSYEVPSAP